MVKLLHSGQAGTGDKGDVVVNIEPHQVGEGLLIELVSPVKQEYGEHIRVLVETVVQAFGITDATIKLNDRGALDFAIKARVETAIKRALA